jgi:STAS domain
VGDPGDNAATVVVVAEGGRELRIIVDEGRCDLGLVDVLMRMALEARRGGYRVRIEGAPPELRGLLELVGLADVVAFEPRRQPELGEHLRVEEVVQPGDAPA